MMVLSLIARDAANCPTYTAPASTAVLNASIDGEAPTWGRASGSGRPVAVASSRAGRSRCTGSGAGSRARVIKLAWTAAVRGAVGQQFPGTTRLGEFGSSRLRGGREQFVGGLARYMLRSTSAIMAGRSTAAW